MNFIRRKLLQAFAASSLLPLVACQPNVAGLPKDKILQKYPLKTYAVGRFLIDLPEIAENVSMSQRIDGTDFEWKSASEDQFATLLSSRVRTLKGVDPKTQFLISDEPGAVPQSRIILFENEIDRDGLLQFEAYRYAAETKGYFLLSGPVARSNVAVVSPSLNEVFKLIQPGIIDPKMTKRGACFDHAFVGGADPKLGEKAVIMARFNDIAMNFVTQVIDTVDSGSSLLQRATKADEYPEVKILRKSKRKVAGLDGAEFAYKTPPGSEITSHAFQWEYRGTLNSIVAPEMSIGLKIPDGTDAAKLSDEELLGLWDTVLGSIRLRPGAV